MMSERLVIVPTYNEIENIAKLVEAVMALSTETDMLIVDDNSPDGTGTRIRELQAMYPGRLYTKMTMSKATR